jgi:carbon monoxide dehydrogenase subunit G
LEIENTFSVAAEPDAVYAYLLDVNRVVGCVPGAQLSKVVDPSTFRGKVKIKVGPVTVTYDGTARIASRDDAARTASIEAEGRETGGPGSARATTHMAVTPQEGRSLVRFTTEFTVVGRVAQFGRGIMEDVSRRIVDQMAACIQTRLEPSGETVEPKGAGVQSAGPADPAAALPVSGGPAAAERLWPTAHEPGEPAALDALAIARGVAADRLGRVRREMVAGAMAGLLFLFALRWRRRRRSHE